MKNTAVVTIAVLIKWILALPLLAVFPGSQIGVMLLAQSMGWWPEPGIFWYDWVMCAILPFYAVFGALFL